MNLKNLRWDTARAEWIDLCLGKPPGANLLLKENIQFWRGSTLRFRKSEESPDEGC